MFLKFLDDNNDVVIVNMKKIAMISNIEGQNADGLEFRKTNIYFQDGTSIEIDKSIDEVEKRFFQLGIKVKEF